MPLTRKQKKDNRTRAMAAQMAMQVDKDWDDKSPEESVTDLLANLAHFCDLHDINFDESITCARRHYYDETATINPCTTGRAMPR